MIKKKILSLTLSLALVAGVVPGIASANEQYYTDVPDSHWAFEWVGYMHEKGYIKGYGDDTYKPAQYITRAEVASIFNNVFESNGTTDIVFSDVNEGDWFYPVINAAVAAGYMHGYNDGTMKPNNRITREEIAVMIADAYNLELNEDVSQFEDADEISEWAVPYVGALSAAGIILGDEGTATYRPGDYLLRAEAAVIIGTADYKASGNDEPTESPEPTERPSNVIGGGAGNGGNPPPSQAPFADRDRVVEALNWYKGIDKDNIATQIAADYAENANRSNDMLMIVLTNDGLQDNNNQPTHDPSLQQAKDAEEWDDVYGLIATSIGDNQNKDYYKALKPVYNDVIAAVLADQQLDYKNPLKLINTAGKDKYVGLFRGMVKVINASADAAMNIYNNQAGNAQTLYDAFILQAINDVSSILNNVYTTYNITGDEKTNITNAAIAYCTGLFTGKQGNSSLASALLAAKTSGGSLDLTEFATILVDCINGVYSA